VINTTTMEEALDQQVQEEGHSGLAGPSEDYADR
tara:strand:- start:2122 stop:2223 length:102 start_codon:yes stop_codon:yes gene_type:complete